MGQLASLKKGYLHTEGNWWLETATIPEHKSYAFTGEGSVWMPKLARALREQNDSFQNIMDKVKTEVVDELKKLGPIMQVGRSTGSLLTGGGLFLQKQPIKTRKCTPGRHSETLDIILPL